MRDDHEPARRSRAQRASRCPASQAMPSTSRWLVGSSRNDDVPVADEQRGERDPAALPAARGCRPWRPTGCRASRPVDDVADARVAGPLVLGRVADDRVARRSGRRVEVVGLVEHADAHAAAAVTRPASGSHAARRARFSSVDLPSPLRPTMPIRSPSSMPSVTSSKTTSRRELERAGARRRGDVPCPSEPSRRDLSVPACADGTHQGREGNARTNASTGRRSSSSSGISRRRQYRQELLELAAELRELVGAQAQPGVH